MKFPCKRFSRDLWSAEFSLLSSNSWKILQRIQRLSSCFWRISSGQNDIVHWGRIWPRKYELKNVWDSWLSERKDTQRRRMTCRATRVSSEWLSALQSQPSPGSRYGASASAVPHPVTELARISLAQDCAMRRGDSLSSESISDTQYDKAEQKSEV